ncbi:MAG: OB-fold nucleic acid binding domain-containing protein, partial [Blastocatellia bacterium]
LKVLPIDVTRSNWECTLEGVGGWELGDGGWGLGVGQASVHESRVAYSTNPLTSISHPPSPNPYLRLGTRYVKGLREEAARAIVRERARRPFTDVDDLHNRVPELRKNELRKLAEVGALNFIGGGRWSVAGNPQSQIRNPQSLHRRSALWQVERAARPAGPLLRDQKETDAIDSNPQSTIRYPQSPVAQSSVLSPQSFSPLDQMTIEERLTADYRGTGLTIGRHPMAYRREELNKLGVTRAIDLREIRNGRPVTVAGWIIVRQRPGTAKGFMFLSMEDETGIANIIVTPQVFDRNRAVLVNYPLLLIKGVLQNQDNVIHVKAGRIRPLDFTTEEEHGVQALAWGFDHREDQQEEKTRLKPELHALSRDFH